MVFGIWLASLDWTYRSESRLLEPSLYPLKQKLLINEFAYDTSLGNIEPITLAENLPTGAFDVTFSDQNQG